MGQRQKIALFDFDGTITKHDTLWSFIKFSRGSFVFLVGIVVNIPTFISLILKIISNHQAKEKIFAFYFKGMSYKKFIKTGKLFADHLPKDIRPKAYEKIIELKKSDYKLFIISASIKEWIEPWANSLGFERTIATEVEVDKNGMLTGKFKTLNCNGHEKVFRLEKHLKGDEYIIAFGNSHGDKELLSIANESHYRIF